jgi:hypothetical protein
MSRVLRGREMGTVRVVGECCCWTSEQGKTLCPNFRDLLSSKDLFLRR